MVFLDPSHSDFVLDRSRASLRRAPARSKPTSLSERTVTAARQVLEGQPLSRHRYLAFTGPAIVASIAYMDPGNFATNVQAGAKYGYSLLWVVLLANLVAMLFQGLSAKLGIVTGRNLAEMCRDEFPRPIVWAMWVVSEFAAMATDLAEFLGGAIGLSLLFHIPLLGGMGATAVIVYGVLLTERRGFRPLELIIGGLVGVIAFCYLIELFIAPVDWGSAAFHMVMPHIPDNEALLLAVGILGATVMPHAIYLHSGLTQARIPPRTESEKRLLVRISNHEVVVALLAGRSCEYGDGADGVRGLPRRPSRCRRDRNRIPYFNPAARRGCGRNFSGLAPRLRGLEFDRRDSGRSDDHARLHRISHSALGQTVGHDDTRLRCRRPGH